MQSKIDFLILFALATYNLTNVASAQLMKTERFEQVMSVFTDRVLNITRIDKHSTNSRLHQHSSAPPIALCNKYPGCLAMSQLYNEGYYLVGTGNITFKYKLIL